MPRELRCIGYGPRGPVLMRELPEGSASDQAEVLAGVPGVAAVVRNATTSVIAPRVARQLHERVLAQQRATHASYADALRCVRGTAVGRALQAEHDRDVGHVGDERLQEGRENDEELHR